MKNSRKRAAWCLCLIGCLLLGGCTFSESPEQKAAQTGISFRIPQQVFAAVPEEKLKEWIPVVEKVTITATGDCTLGATQTHGYEGSFHQYYDDYGETYFFQGVRDVFENDDLTLINPGSISYPRQENRKPSYVIMEIDHMGEAHYTVNYVE